VVLIPKRSTSPRSDIDAVMVDGLKALDPERPIREEKRTSIRVPWPPWRTDQDAPESRDVAVCALAKRGFGPRAAMSILWEVAAARPLSGERFRDYALCRAVKSALVTVPPVEYRGARDDGCNRPSRPWHLLQVYITRRLHSALGYLSPAPRSTDGQRANFARRIALLDYPRSVPAVPLSCGLPISSGSANSSPGKTVLRERHGERRGSLEANTLATGTARGTGFAGIHGEKGGATEEAIHRKHEGTLRRPRTRLRNGNGIGEMARLNRNRAFFPLHLLDRIKCGRDVTPPVRQAHFAVKNQMLEFRTSGSVE
jgi:hypothetical protein